MLIRAQAAWSAAAGSLPPTFSCSSLCSPGLPLPRELSDSCPLEAEVSVVVFFPLHSSPDWHSSTGAVAGSICPSSEVGDGSLQCVALHLCSLPTSLPVCTAGSSGQRNVFLNQCLKHSCSSVFPFWLWLLRDWPNLIWEVVSSSSFLCLFHFVHTDLCMLLFLLHRHT